LCSAQGNSTLINDVRRTINPDVVTGYSAMVSRLVDGSVAPHIYESPEEAGVATA
jgi:hypothetical protein